MAEEKYMTLVFTNISTDSVSIKSDRDIYVQYQDFATDVPTRQLISANSTIDIFYASRTAIFFTDTAGSNFGTIFALFHWEPDSTPKFRMCSISSVVNGNMYGTGYNTNTAATFNIFRNIPDSPPETKIIVNYTNTSEPEVT